MSEPVLMTLGEIIDRLHDYRASDDETDSLTICARRPWTASSEARLVALEEPGLSVPQDVLDEGFEYFLEVEIAAETLEDFEPAAISLVDKVSLVVFYAEYDAYPEWANRRVSALGSDDGGPS